jgi:predicted nucleic acid-binding protein
VNTAAYGGSIYIADTSARVRAGHAAVRDEWSAALRSRQIATCSITTLELLYAARNAHEFRELEADEATLRDIPITVPVQRAAIAALRNLTARGAGYHRVRLPDALIAAAAQQAAVGVLHYDHHYDRLAEVLSFDSRWIAAPGSL